MEAKSAMEKIPVEILGLTSSSASSGAYALILKETHGTRRLPIIIGAWEAQCIALEIEGIRPPRPMTHDLIKTIIETLGSALVEVYISELRDGTFFAKLILEGYDAEIDSRPSDAIALAVRYGAPIYIEESILNDAGFMPESEEDEEALPKKLEEEEGKTSMPAPQKKATEWEVIQHQLEEAIAQENYERAAQLRDQLKRMGHN